jgi:cytochrome c-type biogenesis protein
VIPVSVPLAFAAGLASFLSPCVLPLVPAYLAYLAGGAESPHRGRVLAGALAFVGGVAAVLVLFFYVFRSLLFPLRLWLAPVAGVLVILLAIELAGLRRFRLLGRSVQLIRPPEGGGAAGGLLLGLGFAFGWTPCIGPTLGAVLTSGAVQGTTAEGLALLAAYCVGLALPFLALAFGFEEARGVVAALRRHQRALDLAAAVVLAAMGVLLLTGNFVLLNRAFSWALPAPLQTPFGL